MVGQLDVHVFCYVFLPYNDSETGMGSYRDKRTNKITFNVMYGSGHAIFYTFRKSPNHISNFKYSGQSD